MTKKWKKRKARPLLQLPRFIVEGRQTVCVAIADLPPASSLDDVSSVLDPIVRDIAGFEAGGARDGGGRSVELISAGDGVTPMMVACNKSQLGCLRYIERRIGDEEASSGGRRMVDLMGHPLDLCSDECGGNAAAHLAASAGFAEGVDTLEAILRGVAAGDDRVSKEARKHKDICGEGELGSGRSKSTPNGASLSQHENHDIYLLILGQGNSHNDTPIMIASASGHATALSHWLREIDPKFSLESRPRGSASIPCSASDVRRVFELRNNAGDTALSLAYGHGHCGAVDVLINAVPVSYNDVEKCKAVVAKMDAARSVVRRQGQDKMQEFVAREKKVKRCLVILKVKQAVTAQQSMEELLRIECGQKPLPPQKSNSSGIEETQQSDDGATPVRNSASSSASSVVTLEDGAVLARKGYATESDRHEHDNEFGKANLSLHEDNQLFPPLHQEKKSIDEMLLERYRQGLNSRVLGGHGSAGRGEEDELSTVLEATMDSLCLDASMLLLTPHGMAMKLSPSQLDAIEGVLANQQEAVKEARKIQGRLMSQSK